MPKTFTSNTFSEVYKDDYSDSDGYYRILFNSGKPLQARELTQLQTILQQQITRFGNNIFLDGAAVSSAGAGLDTVDYIVLETLPSGVSAKDYEGVTLQGPLTSNSAGLQFLVDHAEEATDDGDFPTLYGFYRNYNQTTTNQDVQEESPVFSEGDELTDIRVLSGQSGVGNVTVRTQPGSSTITSAGKGLIFSIQGGDFYSQGFFVYAEKQKVVVSKYDEYADVDVGFEVKQDIVTVDDTDALYDNQGAVPNISSPGADRYRIKLVLSEKSSVANPYNFVFYAAIRDGEITQVKGGGSSYNEVEKRMALRTYDTNGDFIVNPFEIRYEAGDSYGQLKLRVPGNVKGLNPTAFVDGFHLAHYSNEAYDIPKPTSHTEEIGTSMTIDYRNYVNVSADAMGDWDTTFGISEQTKINLIDSDNGGEIIGSTRVRHIVNTLDDSEGYRVHLYDTKMKPGKNFRDTTHFQAFDGTNKVAPTLSTGNLYAIDPENNVSLFEAPGGRVKSIHNLRYTVQREFTATSTPAGTLSISTQTNENFDDKSRWVFVNLTTGQEETVVPGNIVLSSGSPQTADVTVAAANNNYLVYAYVEKLSPSPKTKTYTKQDGATFSTATRVQDSAGDRFEFNLYDGISLVAAYADSVGGQEITDLVQFDGGQRDNYYGPVVLKPSGLSSTVSTIHAQFEYFDWGTSGDYFAVNSYVLSSDFRYNRIPTYTSHKNGEDYDLRNHLDFRPKLDPLTDTMTSNDRFEIPRDGDTVSYDVHWYNKRIDNIVVGYDRYDLSTQIRVNQGVEAIQAKVPDAKNNELILFTVEYGGNTLNAKDIEITPIRHKRYRMSDIDKLKKQVDNLEDTVSLSFLEQEAVNLLELNSSGEVRSKTGFFVDDFKLGMNLTASTYGPSWFYDENITTQDWALVSEGKGVITPRRSTTAVNMILDSDDAYSARTGVSKTDVVRKGDLMLLDYKEVLDSSMVNEVISWYSDGRSSEEHGWYNVNPFNVFTGVGACTLYPASDIWHDEVHLPDINVWTIEEVDLRTPKPPPKSGTQGYWVVSPTSGKSIEDVVTDIEENVIAYAVPFARQREIFGKVQGLRPNTRYWAFFDDINVEQWILSETAGEFKDHINNNDHLRGYDDVDVTILSHPRRTSSSDSVLISDYQGELYFSFWLPNNAPVPSPNSKEFNSYEEWEKWLDEQEAAAEVYSDSKDPRVLDDIGWKFRSGTIPFVLNDVSVSDPKKGLSNANTVYAASGSVNVSQKTVHTTRTITYEQEWLWINTGPDPLAQSFTVDGRSGVPGVFVTKVDVFMRRAPQTANRGGDDLAIPLQLQIREVEAGVPKKGIPNNQFRVYKPADEVYDIVNNINDLEDLDDVLSNPVTFEFEEPIFLSANEEYAVVLLAECDDYEAFISTTYGLILGKTEERVNTQPATGSLFLSQNGSTWTPRQDQNMAYRIYTAKFKNEGTFNFVNDTLPKYNHNTKRLSTHDSDLSRFRVNHLGHGLGVGDKVSLAGLDSSSSYLGVLGSNLMDSSLVVDSADISGYYVQLDSGLAFSEQGFFGEDSAVSNRSYYFDRAVFDNTIQNFPLTSIEYEGSFMTGVSHAKINTTDTADPRFDYSGRRRPLKSNSPILFESPKMLGNENQEIDAVSPSGTRMPSIVVSTKLKSTSVSTFGGPTAANIRSAGYVSDVSPIVDLQRATFIMDNFLIDNQPVDSASVSDLSNTPFFYVPETNPTEGSSPSKHIITPIVLEQAANGIRVFVDAFKPPAADIVLYYRTTSDADEDIFATPWTQIEPDNNPPDNQYSPENFNPSEIAFTEYSYLIGGLDGDLPDFTKFQLKVVMKSTNTSEVPYLKSIRAIAVI